MIQPPANVLTTTQERVDSTLLAAWRLIDRPALWTQGATARDRYGKWVAAADPAAAQWSLDGAIWKVAPRVAEAAMAGKCVRAILRLPLDDPTTLWAWADAPGRTLDACRKALWMARSVVPKVISGAEPFHSNMMHPDPVLPWTDGVIR